MSFVTPRIFKKRLQCCVAVAGISMATAVTANTDVEAQNKKIAQLEKRIEQFEFSITNTKLQHSLKLSLAKPSNSFG